MLKIEGIRKAYFGMEVLKGIHFEIRPGEILGLIGPNGAGKTTLMEVVSGILPDDGGRILWNGALFPAKERKKHLFYMPDGVLPFPDFRVIEVLEFFRTQYQSSHEAWDLVTTRLELSSVMGKRVRALSKGYRKRLLIALALLTAQRRLFLDEPFDGLDLRQTLSAMELFKEIRQAGRTLFLSIHQLMDAERVCDRFLLLSHGEIIGAGSLGELQERAGLPSGSSLEEIFLGLA